MTIHEREQALEQLRKDWIDKPWMRKIIEVQAKALKMATDISNQNKLI